MQFTYYGHACFSVNIKGKHLLFDPFISPNEAARHIDVSAIAADYILVSHGHEDHLADAVDIARRTGALVVAAPEVLGWIGKQGIDRVHPLNHGGKKEFDFGSVKSVNAVHSSGLPDGSYGGNPMGFLVMSDGAGFYYSGDTALTMDMQLIPRWGKPSFCVLPIGDIFTMGYEDAAEAARMVQCSRVVGVHYDTFGYIRIDKQAARDAFKAAGIELILPSIGETIDL